MFRYDIENKMKNNLLIFFSSLLKEPVPNLTDKKVESIRE
jgi:hypothetical protein